MQFPYN